MFDINEVWVPLCNPNQGKCLCFPGRLVCQCSHHCCKYTTRRQLKINGSRETLGYTFHTILTLYTASHLHTRQSSSAVSRECWVIHQIKLYNFMRILTLLKSIQHGSCIPSSVILDFASWNLLLQLCLIGQLLVWSFLTTRWLQVTGDVSSAVLLKQKWFDVVLESRKETTLWYDRLHRSSSDANLDLYCVPKHAGQGVLLRSPRDQRCVNASVPPFFSL